MRDVSAIAARRQTRTCERCDEPASGEIVGDQRSGPHCNADSVDGSLQGQIEVVEGQSGSRPQVRNLRAREPVGPNPRKTRGVQQRVFSQVGWRAKRDALQKRRTTDRKALLGQERPHRIAVEGVRAAPDDDTRAIPLPELERLWARSDIPLRERALWRLLYDTAARADEVLRLDVGDLDLANRQARARTKGGHVRPLHFQTAAARLLARLTAGRQPGPVFLTARRAAGHRVIAAADLDPASGRARLSYEMAEQLFKRYSGGKTLHQLRPSRLTHLGEANVNAPLLMAVSGHKRLATLQRYVQPSQAAVTALMAASNPDCRGR